MMDRVKKLEMRRTSRVFGGFPLLPHGVARTLRLRGGLTSGYGKQEDFVAMRTQSYTHYSLASMMMTPTRDEDEDGDNNDGDDGPRSKSSSSRFFHPLREYIYSHSTSSSTPGQIERSPHLTAALHGTVAPRSRAVALRSIQMVF